MVLGNSIRKHFRVHVYKYMFTNNSHMLLQITDNYDNYNVQNMLLKAYARFVVHKVYITIC